MSAQGVEVSAKLIELRAGLARDKTSSVQSILTVARGRLFCNPPPDPKMLSHLAETLGVACALLDEVCSELDEVNATKPATEEERRELGQ
jgi:hypothetical protein